MPDASYYSIVIYHYGKFVLISEIRWHKFLPVQFYITMALTNQHYTRSDYQEMLILYLRQSLLLSHGIVLNLREDEINEKLLRA